MALADKNTNPVLQLVEPYLPLEEDKKYPPKLLLFNDSGWKAYYHCHPSSRLGQHHFDGEHGHFHIFVKLNTKPTSWSHLIALAIDPLGQALGWFSVNHWVTGEKWCNAEELIEYIKHIKIDENMSLIEKWLLSLIVLDQDNIKETLFERDNQVNQYRLSSTDEAVKTDKSIYLLSQQTMNINEIINTNISE